MAAPEDDPAGSAPAIGTVLEGRYELVARLGEGGVGWVYRAKHLRLGTDVAIKMLQAPYDHHESLRPRFEREAQALAQLRHPNIVTMTDYSVADGRPYLVMERLEGRTLAELLEHGPLPEARARRILRQVLDALIYAHGRGFAHRDLKPSNIFLVELPTDPDHVKILDFGFVKLMRDVDGGKRPALTVSGIAFGTPSYMCPEQATGAPTDPRADLYSAGIVLYEMLSGRRPFVGEIPEVIRAHLTEPVPRLVVGEREAGRELRAFLERALAKAPADRFQTAGEMRAALDALPTPGLVRESELRALEQAPTVPPPAPVRGAAQAPGPPAPRRSRPVGIVIAIILLIAGGSFAIYFAIEDGGAGRREAGAADDVPGEAVVGASPAGTGGDRSPDERDPEPPAIEAAQAEASTEAAAGAASAEAAVAAEEAPGDEAHIEEAPIPDEGAADDVQSDSTAAGDPPSPAEAATEQPPTASEPPDPWASRERVPLLDSARRTLARGRPLSPAGERALRQYVRDHRSDPRPHLLLGAHYLERGVDRGALERYALAERVDASARLDPRMLPDLVRLASRAAESRPAGDLVVRVYGRDALAEVERALASGSIDPASRTRLEALRARLSALPPP